jgi:hypothetical protein
MAWRRRSRNPVIGRIFPGDCVVNGKAMQDHEFELDSIVIPSLKVSVHVVNW